MKWATRCLCLATLCLGTLSGCAGYQNVDPEQVRDGAVNPNKSDTATVKPSAPKSKAIGFDWQPFTNVMSANAGEIIVQKDAVSGYYRVAFAGSTTWAILESWAEVQAAYPQVR